MSAHINYKHLRPIQIVPGSAISAVLYPPLTAVLTFYVASSHIPA